MDKAESITLLYVPCGSEDEAARICELLLAQRLVACGNIVRSRSIYPWKGKVADEEEYLLICKTTSERAQAAESLILEMHSYEVPCVVHIAPERVSLAYARWVKGEV